MMLRGKLGKDWFTRDEKACLLFLMGESEKYRETAYEKMA